MINLDSINRINNPVNKETLIADFDQQGNLRFDSLNKSFYLTNGRWLLESNVIKFGVTIDSNSGALVVPQGINSFHVVAKNTTYFTNNVAQSQTAPEFSK